MGSEGGPELARSLQAKSILCNNFKLGYENSEDDAHVLNPLLVAPQQSGDPLVAPCCLLFPCVPATRIKSQPRPVLEAHVFLQPGVCAAAYRGLSP